MENTFRVWLPSGRPAELTTQMGADAFLSAAGSEYLLQTIPQIVDSNSLLGSSNGTRKEEASAFLVKNYIMLGLIANNSSPGVFQEKISEAYLRSFREHAITVMQEVAQKQSWKQSGRDGKPFEELLNTITPLCQHESFLCGFWEDKFDVTQLGGEQ